MITPSSDSIKSFLSVGAQIADEVKRRLDEAAANMDSKDDSSDSVNLESLKIEILDQLKESIATEVERAITRIGVAREDELAALRARIDRMESK
jgi:hypothetical protein